MLPFWKVKHPQSYSDIYWNLLIVSTSSNLTPKSSKLTCIVPRLLLSSQMFPSSTSTDSASSSSSSSPFSHFRSNNNNDNNNSNKTMEEVWKDINVASLPNTPLPHTHYNNNNININLNHSSNIINHNNHNIIHHPTPTTNFRGMILQDFFNCNNPSITTIDSPPVYHNYQQQQQPTTALKLTNEFNQMFDSQNDYNMRGTQNYSAFGTFDALASSSVLNSFGGVEVVTKNKRSLESTPEDANVDSRHKRMIKNRESAARSRARKQAYMTELELEVAHLAAENTRLRKQQQRLLETPSTQLPKKQGLKGHARTLTAPF